MKKSTPKSKSKPKEEKPQLTWDEQIKQMDLNSISESHQIKFTLLNAKNTNFVDHVEILQDYLYIHTMLSIKPIIFEEIQYIVKHYPAWNRPYVPKEIEDIFEKACVEAKTYTRKLKPIPLKLMAYLIKLRAILFLYEHIYCKSNIEENPDLKKLSFDLVSCSTKSELSLEENEMEELLKSNEELIQDDISLDKEYEYDRDIINMVYSYSSPILQGYISAMQTQLNRKEADNETESFKQESLRLWIYRHCQNKKTEATNPINTNIKNNQTNQNDKKDKKDKKRLSIKPNVPSETIYMVLIGFYDEVLIKELYDIGVDFICLIAFGGENEETTIRLPKPEKRKSISSVGLNKFVNPVYYFSSIHTSINENKLIKSENEDFTHLKETIILTFWIKMEELCERNLPYSKNIIWFHYKTSPSNNEERKIGSEAYYKAGAQLYKIISQYIQSITYLEKYHRLYLRSLNVITLGDKPEAIFSNKMFYYNKTLRPIPPDCVNIGHILEGLLDEVCQRVSFENIATSSTKITGRKAISNHNKKMEKFLLRLFRKYKFSYMPNDPISFFNSHSNLLSINKDYKLNRERFEIYDSNKLELETRYYPKIQEKLKNINMEYLKKSFPALLWKIFHSDDNFEKRTTSSLIFQTWLSFMKVSEKECDERLTIEFCKLIKCKERLKCYTSCELHDYFMKPIWTNTVNLKEERRERCKINVNVPEIGFKLDEGNDLGFHWQEKLSPEVLLQEIFEDFIYYDCFDYLYSSFLDKIIVRFHDPIDEFGSAVYIWEESIRSPIGLYNFFKHTIFEESKWLKDLENTLKSLETFPESQENAEQSANSFQEEKSEDFKNIPNILTHIETFEDIFLQSPFTTTNNLLTSFNLKDRSGAGGTTTIFHSTEGLKITVDVTRIFSKRIISLKVQSEGNVFILHANPEDRFLFHFESSNGTRIIFGKPENKNLKDVNVKNENQKDVNVKNENLKDVNGKNENQKKVNVKNENQKDVNVKSENQKDVKGKNKNLNVKGEIIIKKLKRENEPKEKINFITETHQINFIKRSKFELKKSLTEDKLKNIFNNISYENNENNECNEYNDNEINSLRDVESVEDIALKSTLSLTTISKKSLQKPINYQKFFKDLHKTKKNTIPHFKIISTALHKRKYVSLLPNKITVNFLNRSIDLKFIPNLNQSKKIQISKCSGLNFSIEDLNKDVNEDINKDINKDINEDINENINEQKYDLRITLPSGLQILTIPDPNDPKKCLIVQKYLTQSNNNLIKDEVSRIFTKEGYIRIKYKDGSVKMIGLNGREIFGKKLCLKESKSKRNFENSNLTKRIKLYKSIHKKINRFEKKIINKPGLKYIKQKLSKKDKFFKTLFEGFKNPNQNKFFNYNRLTPNELLTPIIFNINNEAFKNHFNFSYNTKNSFTNINKDGEQITTYLDGTKITSWCEISQEMIIISTEDESELLEIDKDDYSCNFLVPKIGGWIDVNLSIQFQHENYATIVYRSNGEEISIYLPDKIEVRIKSDGKYFLNLSDKIYTDISDENIKMKSNFCKKCFDCCETKINIKHLYENNKNIPPYDILLEARDNFNKCFKVEYCGFCHKNKEDINTNKSCELHQKDSMEKFYSFDKNFNGVFYWTNEMFNKVLSENKYKKENIKYYLDDEQTLKAYEIITYFLNHYCDRFLMPYKKPNPPILKEFNLKPKSKCFGKIAYIKKRLVEKLPNTTQIIPLFNTIINMNIKKPWELKLPTEKIISSFSTFTSSSSSSSYLINKPKINISTESINLKLPSDFANQAIKRFNKLKIISKTFKVRTLENMENFTKAFDQNICICNLDKNENDEVILDTFYEKLPSKAPSYKKLKSVSYIDYSSKIPLVPVNSKVSGFNKDSTQTIISNDRYKNIDTEPSLLNFTSQPSKLSLKRFHKNKSLHSKSLHLKDKDKKSNLTPSIVPFMHPGYFEWRKPTMNDSSSTLITNNKSSEEVVKKVIKKDKYLKNKSTRTVQPFDLLGLCEKTSENVNVESGKNENEDGRNVLKNVVGNGIDGKGNDGKGIDGKGNDGKRIDGKVSVVMDGRRPDVMKMTSMDKIFKKVSSLKCCADLERRSFTETRKPKLNRDEEAKGSKFFDELPMILPESKFK